MIIVLGLHVVPRGPVVLAVGLDVSQVEARALGDVQDVAEVQADGVEEDRGHADLVHGPHVPATPAVVRLPPAELDAELPRSAGQLHRHDPAAPQGDTSMHTIAHFLDCI